MWTLRLDRLHFLRSEFGVPSPLVILVFANRIILGCLFGGSLLAFRRGHSIHEYFRYIGQSVALLLVGIAVAGNVAGRRFSFSERLLFSLFQCAELV